MVVVKKHLLYCGILVLVFIPCIECVDKNVLFLSPYIENGQAETGRNLSQVNPSVMLGVTSYSGFITVDKRFNSNTWFWYFPVEGGDVANAPFVIWFQGGPGISSIMGLFSGVGPFKFKNNKLRENPYSWHKSHSVLFIDNPMGAGFSFTKSKEGYATNQTQISTHLYDFLIQFMQLFPELLPLPLYLSGQSYAGKHIPSFAHYIHTKNPSAKTFINLKGMIIGNGWVDPPNMYAYGNFIYQLGLGDLNFKSELEEIESRIDDSIIQGNMTEANWLNYYMLKRIMNTTKISIYNYLYDNDSTCFKLQHNKFLARKKIRKALHVGYTKYTWNNFITRVQLYDDEMTSIVPILEEMLEHYELLVYSGQLDIVVPYPMSQNVYWNMSWSGAEEYRKAVRKPMFDNGKLYGYMKKADKFQELMIRNAGHCVVSENPKLMQTIINQFTCGSRCQNV